jgi:hypothetical protein
MTPSSGHGSTRSAHVPLSSRMPLTRPRYCALLRGKDVSLSFPHLFLYFAHVFFCFGKLNSDLRLSMNIPNQKRLLHCTPPLVVIPEGRVGSLSGATSSSLGSRATNLRGWCFRAPDRRYSLTATSSWPFGTIAVTPTMTTWTWRACPQSSTIPAMADVDETARKSVRTV